MRFFRVNIAGLMVGVIYIGFALAALLHPTQLWSETWLTAALVVLAYAIVGATSCYDPSWRTFWKGFAIVGSFFTVLTYFPASPPRLVTRSLAENYYRTLSFAPSPSVEIAWGKVGQGYQQVQLSPPMAGDPPGQYRVSFKTPGNGGSTSGMFPATRLRVISFEEYQQLWNAVIGLPLAAVGGLLAKRFATAREEPESGL